MDFSIVICTENHADALERTLLGIYGLSIPVGCQWELILVDTGSADQTLDVCQKYEKLIPLRYLREEQQGHGHALNTGISAARGDLILFTDDEVDASPGWAEAMLAAAHTHDEADFFGGKILSRWQGKAPAWFVENADLLQSNPRLDLGDAPIYFVRGDEPRFLHANLAVRKRVFETDLADEDLNGGPDDAHAGPREMDWQKRLLEAGHEGIYLPDALVHHREPPWHMTEKYVRHWYVETGRNRVKQGELPRGPEWLGAPQYLWREYLTNGLEYIWSRRLGTSRKWLAAECRMCLAWGAIKEYQATPKSPAPKNPGTAETPPAPHRPLHRQIRKTLAPWLDRLLVRMGPGAFIAFHWPWPMSKPYENRSITLQPAGDSLADELMCLPVIAEIKRRNPRCRVRLVTRRPEFFRCQPQVDDVAKAKPGRQVVRLAYDSVLPPPRPLISLMGECAGIRKTANRIPALITKPSDEIVKLIDGLPRPLVVVQPLASGSTDNKNWPLPYWRECVQALAADFHIVEVGNEPALPAAELGGRFTSVCGGRTLHDLAYVISRADLYIGPSSGGMHLANASDTPALIIHGGYESPAGYDYENVHPFYSPVLCAPCWRQTCPHDLMCLHAIKPAAVVAQALKMLGVKRDDKQGSTQGGARPARRAESIPIPAHA